MRGLKISKKHGLNPTIPMCFWCGEEKNEIAFLGRLGKEDREAPMHTVLDYEPCEKCAEYFNQGLLLVGVTDHADDRTVIGRDGKRALYPTGVHCVITIECAEQILGPADFESAKDSGRCLIDSDALQRMLSDYGMKDAGCE